METLKHGTEEQWELYSLGRLDSAETAVLEQHLLICATCQEQFEEVESFSLAMRDALRQQPVPAAAEKKTVDWFSWLRKPSFVMAAGMAAAAILLAVVLFRPAQKTPLPVAAVQLTAIRGEMQTVQPTRELLLTLTDAPKSGQSLRVELVNGKGRTIWTGPAQPSLVGVQVDAPVDMTEPGDYFVRLYRNDNSLLHEYGLRVATN